VRLIAREERGFTMPAVILAMSLISLVIAAAATAVNGDLGLTRRDLDTKRAYEAAQAGIGDYQFHLNADTNYWTHCADVPDPSAVNLAGSTVKRRAVGGDGDASYAIELLGATGHSTCEVADPVASMIEQSGPSEGTFRIRSTGYAGDARRSVVATFRRASFLDYLYFTQLETSDPVTYGNQATIDGAYQQCTKTIQEGRYSAPIPGSPSGEFCTRIVFATGDHVNGPLHTNDALLICGQPSFGRTLEDVIAVSSPPQGWQPWGSCGGTSQPNFVGAFVTNAPVLTPPPTNAQLSNIADPSYRFTGQTSVLLQGTQMTITTSSGTIGPVAFPANGVLYVANGPCSSAYSPFTASYPSTSGCGNVIVHGDYSAKLTIAAENDIIVDGNIVRGGNGLLGLISNNFVRVKHPYPTQTCRTECGSGTGSSGLTNLRIDAAILAINHSFIVDHYSCGSSLGELTVNGAIGQKFRGAVGLTSGAGYLKDYNYDDRLRYLSPPHFLDPVESAWHVQRETLDQ
jgi:type II secretory pathway pseudopilin PulG